MLALPLLLLLRRARPVQVLRPWARREQPPLVLLLLAPLPVRLLLVLLRRRRVRPVQQLERVLPPLAAAVAALQWRTMTWPEVAVRRLQESALTLTGRARQSPWADDPGPHRRRHRRRPLAAAEAARAQEH